MEELNLRDMFEYYLSKSLFIFVVAVVAVTLSCAFSVFFKTPMYQSYTTIVLAGTNTDTEMGITQNEVTLNQKLVSTYREIIKSRRILGQVVDNLKLETSIEALSSNTTVTTVKDTELIKITVEDQDAVNAKAIADEIAKVFSREIVKIYNIQNVVIIDKGEVAQSPYNINLIKDIVLAALIGVVISCAIIFILYYFDTTIKSSEEVEEKIGLPILGTVPDVNRVKEEK